MSVTSRIIATSQNNIHYYIEHRETMQHFFRITQKESEALSRLRDNGPASRFRLQYVVTRSSTLLLYLTVKNRYYFWIVATAPAPTVRPPSRMENFVPSSIAIGAIS